MRYASVFCKIGILVYNYIRGVNWNSKVNENESNICTTSEQRRRRWSDVVQMLGCWEGEAEVASTQTGL